MRYFVEVHGAGVVSQRHELLDTQATLGALADAGVRIEVNDGTAMPLLLLSRQADAVAVQLPEGVSGSLTFRGEPTRAVAVPWGEDIYVGGVRLAFVAEGGKPRRSGGLVLVVGLLAAVSLGAALLGSSSFGGPQNTQLEAPPLVKAAAPCAERAPASAKALASQALTRALAKRQRAPFDRADGVEALELFGQAKACFVAAGTPKDAELAERARAELQGQLDEEYAALRLRLRMSLDQKRWEEAAASVQALDRLLTPRGPSAYRAWLTDLGHDLERRVQRSGR